VGERKLKAPLITMLVAVPLKVKSPKPMATTVPLPLPLVPVRVPLPDPTPEALKEKVMVFPETVPDAVPVWMPSPRAERSILPVPDIDVAVCVRTALRLPDTL
jgi:hypothetical protein